MQYPTAIPIAQYLKTNMAQGNREVNFMLLTGWRERKEGRHTDDSRQPFQQ